MKLRKILVRRLMDLRDPISSQQRNMVIAEGYETHEGIAVVKLYDYSSEAECVEYTGGSYRLDKSSDPNIIGFLRPLSSGLPIC